MTRKQYRQLASDLKEALEEDRDFARAAARARWRQRTWTANGICS